MEHYIGRQISVLYRKGSVYTNQALRKFNITSAEYPFLFCLYKDEGMTQEELAVSVIIDKGAAARAVGSLEEKGYLRREKDPSDKRANRVFLTERGRAIKDEVCQLVWNWSRFLTADLSEEKQKLLFELINEIVEKATEADIRTVLGQEEK